MADRSRRKKNLCSMGFSRSSLLLIFTVKRFIAFETRGLRNHLLYNCFRLCARQIPYLSCSKTKLNAKKLYIICSLSLSFIPSYILLAFCCFFVHIYSIETCRVPSLGCWSLVYFIFFSFFWCTALSLSHVAHSRGEKSQFSWIILFISILTTRTESNKSDLVESGGGGEGELRRSNSEFWTA